MSDLEITPAWLVVSRDSDDAIIHFEKFSSVNEAEHRAADIRGERPDLSVGVDECNSIVPDNTLPSPDQRKQLCKLMQHAFVAIRYMGYQQRIEPMTELADIFHNLPVEMYEPSVWDWNYLRYSLEQFSDKYGDAQPYPFAEIVKEIQKS